jgi:hypothetical protein
MRVSLDLAGIRIQVDGLAGWVTLAVLGFVGAVLADQLRRPPEERTWRGRLWGAVPYDFRPPTIERLWRSFWDPTSERLFTDRAFGIGWDLNLAALRRRAGPDT